MAGNADQNVTQASLKGYRILSKMVEDFMNTLLAMVQQKTLLVSNQVVQKIFSADDPFPVKAEKIKDLLESHVQDESTKQYLLNQLDELVRTERDAAQGIDSIIRMVKKAEHISQDTRDHLINSLNAVKQNRTQLYSRTLASNVYYKLIQLLKEQNLLGLSYPEATTAGRMAGKTLDQDVKVLEMNGIDVMMNAKGEHIIMYRGALMHDQMKNLINQAILQCGKDQSMSKEEYDAARQNRAEQPSMVADIILEGLSPEFAEKICREAQKSSTIIFFKEPQDDGTVTLRTDAGPQGMSKEDVKIRNKIYTKINDIIAGSAFALTGKQGELEKKRMRYFIRRDKELSDKVNAALKGKSEDIVVFFPTAMKKDGITKYNIESRAVVTQDAASLTMPDKSKLFIMNGNQGQDVRRYIMDKISHNSTSFILTKSELHALTDKAQTYTKMLQQYLKNPDKKISEQINSTLLKVESEMYDLMQQKNDTVTAMRLQELREQKSDLEMLQDMVKDDAPLPSTSEIRDGMLSVKAAKTRFTMKIPRADKEIVKAENDFLKYEMTRLRENTAHMMQNPLTPDLVTEHKHRYFTPEHAEQILDMINTDYVAALGMSAVPDLSESHPEYIHNNEKTTWPVEKDQYGNITTTGVMEVNQILDNHIDSAKELIQSEVKMHEQYLQTGLEIEIMPRSERLGQLEKAYETRTEEIAEKHTKAMRQITERESMEPADDAR
jgi:hypothetical protein